MLPLPLSMENRSGGDQCSCLDTSACAGEATVSVQARQLQAAACGGDGVGGCGYLAQSCRPEAVDRFRLPETVISPVSIWPLAIADDTLVIQGVAAASCANGDIARCEGPEPLEIIPFMEAFTAFMRRLPLELSVPPSVQVTEPVFVEPEPLETTSLLAAVYIGKVMLRKRYPGLRYQRLPRHHFHAAASDGGGQVCAEVGGQINEDLRLPFPVSQAGPCLIPHRIPGSACRLFRLSVAISFSA